MICVLLQPISYQRGRGGLPGSSPIGGSFSREFLNLAFLLAIMAMLYTCL